MSSNNPVKRSYTVPVLLVIIVALTVLVVLLYSKQLLNAQNKVTEDGRGLAERYNYSILFADRLYNGADAMLAGSAGDMMRGAKMIGQAVIAAGEGSQVLIEARWRQADGSREEAAMPIVSAMNRIIGDGALAGIGEHDGPLTEDEIAILSAVRDGTAAMSEALAGFRPPSGEAGYRQMANTPHIWTPAALAAAAALEQLASDLSVLHSGA